MTCNESAPLIEGYFDEELDLVRSLEIEKHVAGCADCSRLLKDRQAMRLAIKSADLGYHAPASLAAIVREQGGRQAPEAPKAAWWDFQAWVPAFAMTALIALCYVGTGVVARTTAEQRLSDDVVSAHVRSLMVTHLTDVTSTNQHTVKPWFNGKIDFAPSVKDLAAYSFPLIGGRLDYLSGRPVAALVYQRHQHFINLFLWPSPKDGDRLMHAVARRGYNLATWTKSGMTYWAVSDLNAQELQEFAQIFQNQTAS